MPEGGCGWPREKAPCAHSGKQVWLEEGGGTRQVAGGCTDGIGWADLPLGFSKPQAPVSAWPPEGSSCACG